MQFISLAFFISEFSDITTFCKSLSNLSISKFLQLLYDIFLLSCTGKLPLIVVDIKFIYSYTKNQ